MYWLLHVIDYITFANDISHDRKQFVSISLIRQYQVFEVFVMMHHLVEVLHNDLIGIVAIISPKFIDILTAYYMLSLPSLLLHTQTRQFVLASWSLILGSFRLLPRHARFLPYSMTVCTVVFSLFSPDFITLNVTESLVTPWFDISDGLPPFPHNMTVCTVVYV